MSVCWSVCRSVCRSVCLSPHHADNSTMSASIEMGLAQNESQVFWNLKVYFYKSKYASIHPHE